MVRGSRARPPAKTLIAVAASSWPLGQGACGGAMVAGISGALAGFPTGHPCCNAASGSPPIAPLDAALQPLFWLAAEAGGSAATSLGFVRRHAVVLPALAPARPAIPGRWAYAAKLPLRRPADPTTGEP